MFYLFVLGRDAALSKLEIESVLENKKITFRAVESSDDILVVECPKLELSLINELGGVIKIAEVISTSGRIDQIESTLDKLDLYTGERNKIEYYIDAFSTGLLSFLETYLKAYFRTIALKAIYRKTAEPSTLTNKNILTNGVNFVLFKNYLGKVIALTNPKELKKRDLERPDVDYMKTISLRLAKMLINICMLKEGELLLDPFCGSGTILQEALLKNLNVFGVDVDKTSLKKSRDNIAWLVSTYSIKQKVTFLELNCLELGNQLKRESIDGVVTEPYMGPFIRKLPSMAEARVLISELSGLYDGLLANLKLVVKKGKRVVIIIPKFRTRENKTLFLDFKSIVEKNGFFLAASSIPYGYKESKLLREIYVLEKG